LERKIALAHLLTAPPVWKKQTPQGERRNRVVVALEFVSKIAAEITDDRALGNRLRM
jgi:hypothetical protein